MNDRFLATTDSPAGPLHLAVNSHGALVEVSFGCTTSADAFHHSMARHGSPVWDSAACQHVISQVSEYTARSRVTFDIPLAYTGSTWEMRVWAALQSIPYGETRSYGQIATELGEPTMARAVGWANHVIPIPVIIPCHRVIGAQGNLTGFGGGMDAKIRLLAHEGAMLPGFA
jgi:methylated-DNA-[protein]-cysteine S-methyltransferase